MAQHETPLLRDFLGVTPCLKEDSKQLSPTTAPDYPTDSGKYSSSSTEEVEQEVHTALIRHCAGTDLHEPSSARLVTSSGSTLSLFQSSEGLVTDNSLPCKGCDNWLCNIPKCQEARGIKGAPNTSQAMDTDALDSCRLFKRSRLDDKKGRDGDEAAQDDLILSMQPPRQGMAKPSSLHPSSTSKFDAPMLVSKAWDSTRPASLGMLGPGSNGHRDNTCKDRPITTNFHVPPADEGSRTGLKGSGGGNMLNQAMTKDPSLLLNRSKSASHLAGQNSTCLASREATPMTRQLTIFYGGQAHVFEDVSSDKAEAIITLAGSSGRSWSTNYSPLRNSASFQSGSKASLASIERERANSGSKQNFMNDMEANGALSMEMRNGFSTLVPRGLGGNRTGDSASQGPSSRYTKWSTADTLANPDHIGKKPPEGKE